jgi:hypothetical protein
MVGYLAIEAGLADNIRTVFLDTLARRSCNGSLADAAFRGVRGAALEKSFLSRLVGLQCIVELRPPVFFYLLKNLLFRFFCILSNSLLFHSKFFF